MSLNGLDAPAIAQAAQALETDASAWLLLKYATRDEVELYASGKGGVTEAASKIEEYEDKSPLYGLAGNAGTRILVKYVPEGTSRLLQARVKVHFESLESHFAHDSELSISTAQELAGAAVTPAPGALTPDPPAPIQKPPASVAPAAAVTPGARTPVAVERVSNESEQLGAIKEEEETRVPSSRTARLLADVRAGKLESHEVLAALKITHALDSDKASASTNPQEWPERSSSLNNDKEQFASATSPPTDLLEQFPSPRQSFSSNAEPYTYKPKVKLGPRPTQLSETTPSNISSLPAGISVPIRSPQSPAFPPPARPSSSQTAHVPFRLGENSNFPIVQAPASVVGAGYLDRDRPKSRAGSVITLPASYGSHHEGVRSPKSPKDIPQEKIRLMKALELRRKQQAKDRKAQEASSAEPSPNIPSSMASPASTNGALPPASTHVAATTQPAATAGLGIGIEENPSLLSPDNEVGLASTPAGADPAPRAESAPGQNGEAEARKETQISHQTGEVSQDATLTGVPQLPKAGETRELHLEQKNTEQVQPPHVADEKEGGDKLSNNDQTVPQSAAQEFAAVEKETVSTASLPKPSTDATDLTPKVEKSLQQIEYGESQVADQAPVDGPGGVRDSALRHSRPYLHTKDISISTSLSSASFLDELDESTVEEAQPVTFVKSPVTPTYQKSFEFDAKAPANTQARGPEHDQGQQPKTEEVKQEAAQSTLAVPVAEEPTIPQESSPVGVTAPTVATETEKVSEAPKEETPPVQQEATIVEETKAPETLAPSSLQPVPESAEPTPTEAEVRSGKAGSDHTVKAEDTEASKEREPLPSDSAVTSPSASEDRSSAIDESSPLSTSRGGSPPTKKHPTVNAPHIWGGPLRAASNASGGGPSRHLSPAPDLQRLNRSASIASNNSGMMRPDSPSGVKKAGVGSRIADRIKALEKSSGGAQSSSSGFVAPSAVSVSSRKSSFNTPPGSSGTDALRKGTGPYPTPSPSPGSNIFTRRFASMRGPSSEAGFTDNTVRPTQLHSHSASNDLQRPTARPTYLRQQSSDREPGSRGSSESAKKAETKPPSRDGALSPSQKRGSFGSHRLSFSGKRESSDTVRTGHSRQSSVESTGTNSEKNKDNKAKKLLKRMTGAFSPRKDKHGGANLSSEPIMEGVEQDSPTEKLQPPDTRAGAVSRGDSSRPASKWNNNSGVVVVGEVNIQFPDTLLWKRRHMELDGDGYMILLPTTMDRSSRVASKRYHMSEFYAPYIPDQEREELPYSVILDFMDSSTLQCACQNTTDQTNVLQALTSIHAAFADSSRR